MYIIPSNMFMYLTTVCLYFQASVDRDQCSLRCASDFTEPSQLRCNGSGHGPAHSLCYPWLPVHCDEKGQLDIIDLCKTNSSGLFFKVAFESKVFYELRLWVWQLVFFAGGQSPFQRFLHTGRGSSTRLSLVCDRVGGSGGRPKGPLLEI